MNRAFVFIAIALLLASAALCQDAPSPVLPSDPAPMFSAPVGQQYNEPVPKYEETPENDNSAPVRLPDFSAQQYKDGSVPPVVEPVHAPDFSAKQFTDKQWSAFAPSSNVLRVRNHDNGIVVGQPKLFELRSVQMMIDSVKASIAQTTFPDPSQLFGMTGHVQGVNSTSHDQSVEVTGSLGTQSSNEMRQSSASVGGAGRSQSGPSIDTQSGVSLSPSDVLAEQTSLWHELMNLQMLLDGALSDRLIPADENGSATAYGDSVKFSPRAQAIIGFQISVDPLQDYRNAVAEATIIIDNKTILPTELGGYGNEPSLMMLLPRDKTYNSISINRDTKSFGLGALVNVFSLGMSQDKRAETYYIAKDTDTVALERIPGLPVYGLEQASSAKQRATYRGVSFGWQFRPVFNRPSVAPGVRQVFAMLSLPASVLQDKWEGKVHVLTYWRRYDRATGAVGKPIEGTVSEWDLDDIIVPIGSGVEEALKPQIDRAQWEDAGSGNAVVTIEGSNFSLGTDIAYGNAILGEKGLSYASAKRIRFIVPASAVVRGDITVMGRYGTASLKQSIANSDDLYSGAKLAPPRLIQQGDQTTAVELTLSQVANPTKLLSDRPPLVQLDGQLFGIGEKPFTSMSADDAQQTLTIRFSVPTDILATARELTVRDLLGPASFSVGLGAGEGACVVQNAVVLSTGDPVSVALFGSGFQENLKILVGGKEATDVKLNSASQQAMVVTFQVDRETALNTKYILVTQGNQPPVLVPFSMPVPSAAGRDAGQAVQPPLTVPR